jgi:DNA-binding HxlR family transcriptional regulator
MEPWMFGAKKEFKCPIELTLNVLKNKWKLMVLRELVPGARRFSELLQSINGISEKSLAYALRGLEKDCLISRKVYPCVPPKVEYSRTDNSRELHKVLTLMAEWGLQYGKLTGKVLTGVPPDWWNSKDHGLSYGLKN